MTAPARSLPPVLKNIKFPVIGSPLFIISNPKLVIAQCKAGVVGSMPALNARPAELLDEWLAEITETLAAYNKANPDKPAAPFAINQIVHKSNDRLEHDMGLCAKYKVPIVITSLGAVKALVDAVHSYGGLVFHDVTTRRHAEKAAEAGVDGLIAVAAGAGGHAGTWSPFSLIAEIRQFFDKTLLLAGCLNHGHEILAAQLLGADLAYLGTRFIATQESHAGEAYKQMLLDAKAADIIHTPAVSGIPASFMRQSLQAAGYDLQRLQDKGEVNYGEKLKPVSDEAKAWKTVWSAGQGVGDIDDLPSVAELVARLDAEYRAARQRFTPLEH